MNYNRILYDNIKFKSNARIVILASVVWVFGLTAYGIVKFEQASAENKRQVAEQKDAEQKALDAEFEAALQKQKDYDIHRVLSSAVVRQCVTSLGDSVTADSILKCAK